MKLRIRWCDASESVYLADVDDATHARRLLAALPEGVVWQEGAGGIDFDPTDCELQLVVSDQGAYLEAVVLDDE